MGETVDVNSVYTLYVNDMFIYGKYLGFEREVIKDAIHDVFVKITEKSEVLDGVSSMKYYLFKALKNRLLDIYTKEHRNVDINEASLKNELPFVIDVNVEKLMINEEKKAKIKSEVEEMLSILSPRQREIIYLKYVQDYDYEEIANLMQITVHSCRKLVSKAIVTLRERFVLLSFILQ